MLDFCGYRSIFVKNDGKLGLGPAQVVMGMSIYLISGLGTPLILKTDPASQGFFLHGECYVEELMGKGFTRLQREYVELI